MNCKPGDLAVIVGKHALNVNRLVNVLRTYKGELIEGIEYYVEPGIHYWVIESAGASPLMSRMEFGPPIPCKLHVARDASLRPIRDPGDDATDQTLEWLPVPSRETEVA